MTLPSTWRDPKIVTPLNLKGGVGKSTVAEGIARAWHLRTQQPVLLVDANTEGGLTRWASAGDPRRFKPNLGTALHGQDPAIDAVYDLGAIEDDKAGRRAQWSGQHLIPTTSLKIRVDQMGTDEGAITYASLRRLLLEVMRESARRGIHYAGAVVDPGHNDTDATLLAAVAADTIIPVISARASQSVDQLAALFKLFEQARRHLDHQHMRMGGIVVTDYDRREYMHRQVVRTVTNTFGAPSDAPDREGDYLERYSDRFWAVTVHRAAVERAINSHQVFDTYGREIDPLPATFDAIVRDRIIVNI